MDGGEEAVRPNSWSDLLPDLLTGILGRLEISDAIRSSAVCTSWRAAAASLCYRRRQTPWLMFLPAGRAPDSAHFLPLSEKNRYEIPLPSNLHNHFCIGSSHGWLITADTKSDLHLFNPITGVQVPLPSISTFDSDTLPVRSDAREVTRYFQFQRAPADEYRYFMYRKAILSAPPSADGSGDYSVMLIFHANGRLAFFHTGYPRWISMPPILSAHYVDINFRDGTFHAISRRGEIDAFCLDGSIVQGINIFGGWVDRPPTFEFSYIVQTPEGGFLLVRRRRHYDEQGDAPPATLGFKIFYVDFDGQCLVDYDLEDLILFLGINQSTCLSARDFPELRANCIYFTEDFYRIDLLPEKEGVEIGIYDLENRIIEKVLGPDELASWIPCPTWITPTLV